MEKACKFDKRLSAIGGAHKYVFYIAKTHAGRLKKYQPAFLQQLHAMHLPLPRDEPHDVYLTVGRLFIHL